MYSVQTITKRRKPVSPETLEKDRARQAKYRADKRYENTGASKRSQHMKRVRALMLLGGKCEQCSTNDMRVLDFDHVRNNGAEHRRAGFRGHKLVADVFKNPFDYQVLCSNCNRIKYSETLSKEHLYG